MNWLRVSLFSFPSEVNERAARFTAGAVAITIVVALILNLPFVLPLLAIGFWLRVGFGSRVSPLARIAARLARRTKNPVLVPGRPKRFAQLLGALVTTTASLLLFSGNAEIGWTLAALVSVLAIAEAAFAACLGCWLYGRCAVRIR